MRILFAGASGVIGRQAVPGLVAAGHEIVGTSRSGIGRALVRRLGADAIALEARDRQAVLDAVRKFRPEVIVNMLTDLKTQPSIRRLDRTMSGTNALRTAGTDAFIAAGRDVGVRRYVAQSFAGWFSEPGTSADDGPAPLMATPPPEAKQTTAALRHLETAVTAADNGIVLRFGPLYGPGTSVAEGGAVLEEVRRRRLPVVGRGAGVWSMCHVQDAGRAVALAVDSPATGVFDIVDDDPAAVATWLPALAEAVGAPAPRRAPEWLARPLIGRFGVHLMTSAVGASNARAAHVLGFEPTYPSWRDGFRSGLGRAA